MRIPRSLAAFWIAILTIVILGAGWLQYLGPIKSRLHPAPQQGAAGIPAPSPFLLAASPVDPAWKIPHPGPYGVVPMRYYAARASLPTENLPYIAIMVAGLGDAKAASLAAVRDLPPAVSLALTPYGAHIARIEVAARAAGHETILGLPMQVAGEPATTAGDQALHAGSSAMRNHKRLDWALSRVAGYAGTTDAVGLAAPETYLAHPSAAAWLAKHLAADGVFLIVATPGIKLPSGIAGRRADILIHPSQGVAAEKQALGRLAAIATQKGSAFGVLAMPAPRAIRVLATWCKGLKAHGYTLVPVSALTTQETAP
ncbi:divergent polysaccharide deacetylase family protein [Acidiphilium sp. AL]|uniref:Divergent polysaccharide deacetylase family protein n=1 Tax=Acidiphilium iwatense TaxID=768198 RepID=A0ABS9E098_9PROT|nr:MULTISPECIES: divergent polysaccharide deacetylase family protein [Acidiphilium]MCF3948369.1 divergent polysaccharide deacetylase family protein [Acidiphilium iwatense]MCU4161352.1 divergent polysaccharide deacetylase family protein [Acidiphilium sp. AL]